jgi:hypothetical protein
MTARPTAKNTVRNVDRGLARVAARLVGKHSVRVGLLADAPKQVRATNAETGKPEKQDSEASLLQIAVYHEFGAPRANIPARSFIRAGVDELRTEIVNAQGALARQIAALKIDGRTAMERLGARVVGLLKARMSRGIEPPLLQATIDAKGSSKPLIDTGQLRSAITWIVEPPEKGAK